MALSVTRQYNVDILAFATALKCCQKAQQNAPVQPSHDSFELMNSIILLYHATVKLLFKQRVEPPFTGGAGRVGSEML
jgi:hypothetical protein